MATVLNENDSQRQRNFVRARCSCSQVFFCLKKYGFVKPEKDSKENMRGGVNI